MVYQLWRALKYDPWVLIDSMYSFTFSLVYYFNVFLPVQKWLEEHSISELSAAMPQWVNTKVVPVYTLSSVTFCKDLPGQTLN